MTNMFIFTTEMTQEGPIIYLPDDFQKGKG